MSSFPKLTTLDLKVSDKTITYTEVFFGLPNLQVLKLKGLDSVRNIDFVKNMPKLNTLHIDNCPILSIEPLLNNPTLTELRLDFLSSLKDVSSLSSIKNLKILDFSSPSNNIDEFPNLISLQSLEKLTIPSNYIYSVKGLVDLKVLDIIPYSHGDEQVLSTLTGLQELTVKLNSDNKAASKIISELPNLKVLHIELDFLGNFDLTPLFESPTIEELDISQEDHPSHIVYLDLNALPTNQTLKKLKFDGINIISLNDSSETKQPLEVYKYDFFKHFPAIEELSIINNGITSLDFVSHMSNLRSLDISENYVEDVSPLLELKNLETLYIKNNAIKNLNLLPDTIRVYSY